MKSSTLRAEEPQSQTCMRAWIATACFRRWVPVSSIHLGISSVWKSLVASCVLVWGWSMNVCFNAFVSSTKVFITSAKCALPRRPVFISSTISAFVFFLEGGLENPSKRTKTREKSFCKISFQLGWAWKKDKNKAEMKERKKITLHLLCIFADVR